MSIQGRPDVYGRAFFDLQLAFAEAVAERLGELLEAVLLKRTNLYRRFGLGRGLDAGHPEWQRYLEGLRDASDPRAWTFRFYSMQQGESGAVRGEVRFGCFSYGLLEGGRARLHFENVEPNGSPLAASRVEARRAELRDLASHLVRRCGPDTPVVGASWLYNLPAYRRLFPPAYVEDPRPLREALHSMALWGQLVDRLGSVRERDARALLAAVAGLKEPDGLVDCFPLPALTVTAPVREFQSFYARDTLPAPRQADPGERGGRHGNS